MAVVMLIFLIFYIGDLVAQVTDKRPESAVDLTELVNEEPHGIRI